jgi:hypothetical protein
MELRFIGVGQLLGFRLVFRLGWIGWFGIARLGSRRASMSISRRGARFLGYLVTRML